ncbi:MAG TPA: bifunctional DNA-binding transcriptional regulator/O6-methylguanine-DNA methyltransferase Ada [Candidatus Dormibacteraeota bacterium]|nr:bifunctional DNA-binding transcriptional regulator/O6-methylguanine-DNA methyltransferase Ada [Candidatus Dormibacteraeota bacterium]
MIRRTDRAQGISGPAAVKCWRASLARDTKADGAFVLAVKTTHIYCRPSCPARRPLRRNVEFYPTREEAEKRGFRPCRRCRPNEISRDAIIFNRVTQVLISNTDEQPRLGPLARELGVTVGTIRRVFQRVAGITAAEFGKALRIKRFKQLLRAGKGISEALYETGYGSPSRVYERSNAQLGMTPAIYRKGGLGMKMEYTMANCALGKVLVAATDRGVSAIYLGDEENALISELKSEYPKADIAQAHDGRRDWVKEIVERIAGKAPRAEVPTDLQATAFQRRVWQELQRIPQGKTRTYSQVARAIGQPKAIRAVARACATNPVSIVVPCHRVIREDGNLAGYRWGLSRKEKLLQHEQAAAK